MRFDEKKRRKKKTQFQQICQLFSKKRRKKLVDLINAQSYKRRREYYLTSNGERTRGQIVIFLRTSWGTNYSQW